MSASPPLPKQESGPSSAEFASTEYRLRTAAGPAGHGPGEARTPLGLIGRGIDSVGRLRRRIARALPVPRVVRRFVLASAGLCVLICLLVRYAGELARFDLRAVDARYAVAAGVLALVSQTVMHLRWWCLLPRNGSRPSAPEACGAGFAGGLCDYALVAGYGGMAFRAAWLVRRHGASKSAAIAGVVVDRTLGVLTLLATGAVATLLIRRRSGPDETWSFTPTGLGLGLLAAAAVAAVPTWLIVVRRPFFGSGAAVLAAAVAWSGRRRMGLAVVCSFSAQLAAVSSLSCVAAGIRETAPGVLEHALALSATEIVAAAVPVPAGVGVREAAMTTAYDGLATTPARGRGVTVALGSRVAGLAAMLAGVGVFGLLRRGRRSDGAGASVTSEPRRGPP